MSSASSSPGRATAARRHAGAALDALVGEDHVVGLSELLALLPSPPECVSDSAAASSGALADGRLNVPLPSPR
jgi:hypothetical protein